MPSGRLTRICVVDSETMSPGAICTPPTQTVLPLAANPCPQMVSTPPAEIPAVGSSPFVQVASSIDRPVMARV